MVFKNYWEILKKEALKQLELIEQKMQDAKVKQINYLKPWSLIILKTAYTPIAWLWQEGVLEWIYLPHIQVKMVSSYPFMCNKLIIKGRIRSRELFGKEMHEIVIPYNEEELEYLLQTVDDWGIAFAHDMEQINIMDLNALLEPISDAILVFTVGSFNGTSVVYIKDRPTISKRNFCTAGGNYCNYYCP